jgi:hypothetical protein
MSKIPKLGRNQAAIICVLTIVAACTPKILHYRNSLHPEYHQVEFDRDKYECQKENEHPATTIFGNAAVSGTVINQNMVQSCLAARGWHVQPN